MHSFALKTPFLKWLALHLADYFLKAKIRQLARDMLSVNVVICILTKNRYVKYFHFFYCCRRRLIWRDDH
jgi:hypothetical protein